MAELVVSNSLSELASPVRYESCCLSVIQIEAQHLINLTSHLISDNSPTDASRYEYQAILAELLEWC